MISPPFLMEYTLTVAEAPRPTDSPPTTPPPEVRHVLSVNPGLSFQQLIEKLVAYATIWHVQVPRPEFIAGRITAAYDQELGFGEIAFCIDSQGMFSPKIHILTILAYD